MLEVPTDDHGVLLRRDAVAQQIHDDALRRWVRGGVLTRVRQGVYILTKVWDAADRTQRHLLLVHAVQQLYAGCDVALSHVSATVVRGGPTWRLDLDAVHLTDLAGHGDRTGAGIVHHRGAIRVNDVTRRDGRWITTSARNALETASLLPRDPAVCVLDWYLNSGLVTEQQLDQQLALMADWPNSLNLQMYVRLSNGKSASVGESRSRLIMRDQKLPEPELQFKVFHPDGRLAGIADFCWPGLGLLGEFDGRAKYVALARPGESVEDVVLREKHRENLLRELTQFNMVRWDWADLNHPGELGARLRRAMLPAKR